MQEKPNGRPKVLPGLVYTSTPTKYIAQRGDRFLVRWSEHRSRKLRTFSSYEAACAFVRDYVIPYRQNKGVLPPTAIAPSKGNGWIYVFRSSGLGEPVKIGWSSDPAKRLSTLRTGHPYKIDLVMLLPSGRGLEKAIHARLAEYRLQGEWFSREAESLLTSLVTSGIAGKNVLHSSVPSPDPADTFSLQITENEVE